MNFIYYKCKCGNKECNSGFPVAKCSSNKSNRFLAIISEVMDDEGIRIKRSKNKKKYGIASVIRVYII